MPLFTRRSNDSDGKFIGPGEIPPEAERRLEAVRREGGRFFTSDLSVNEFLVARHAGVRPISQVMGSSLYHMGRQTTYSMLGSGELRIPTEAMNECRALALQRLDVEAALVAADAVVGVHVTLRWLGWTEGILECVVFGTAVRLEGVERSERPALSNLSGQDFWKLHEGGYSPLGVCASTSIYNAIAPWQMQSMGGAFGGWFNQELVDYTAAMYDARRIAMGRVYGQARALGADGVVGVQIEQSAEAEGSTQGNMPGRMVFRFAAIGTAIRRRPGEERDTFAGLAYDLRTGRGQNRSTS